jgi:CheY-like chemotaxis protein
VRQNAGGIEVASQVGAGTTFTLYLPVVEDAATAPGQEPVEALPKGTELILLVEDEPLVREVATRVLQRLGYDVRACPDPAAALAAMPGLERIPLLLTDLVMPGMNGRELADEVRRLRPGTRVLFATGYTDDEIVRLGVMDRDYDLLPKPYTPAELARRVRQALDTTG